MPADNFIDSEQLNNLIAVIESQKIMPRKLCFATAVLQLFYEQLLSRNELLIYLTCQLLCRTADPCITSDKRLRKLLRMDTRTIRRSREALDALGLVRFEPCTYQGQQVFSIRIEQDWDFQDFTHIPLHKITHNAQTAEGRENE